MNEEITLLQEKNRNRKKLLKHYKQIHEKDLKEIERLNNKVEELLTLYTSERYVKEDYKSRNEEAIDYIEHLSNVFIDSKEQDKILEILGGSDSNVI